MQNKVNKSRVLFVSEYTSYLSCGGADWRRKIGGFNVPMAAAMCYYAQKNEEVG
jgi:hypothetical protein